MSYVCKTHSKHFLMVHLIFVCKYRKPLLSEFGHEIKEIIYDICQTYDYQIIEMEVDENHIHLLLQYPPTISIVAIVRNLKQISTYRIWRQNNNHTPLSHHFWREKTFWSDGYFACSVGNASKEVIAEYIRNQG